MIRSLALASTLAAALALPASAQSTQTPATPGVTMAPTAAQAPMAATPAVVDMTLTEQEGRSWIDKPIYSSDGEKLGEVVIFQRDAADKVLGMHADIGGFLGMMQTRVNVLPSQFRLRGDRIVLDLTAEQAKALPKVES